MRDDTGGKVMLGERFKDWLPPILYSKLLASDDNRCFNAYHGKNVLVKNSELKGSRRGKRAFLLATGPSLKLEDLRKLAGEDCYSISNFFLHEYIGKVSPRFHFFAPYHPPLIEENYVEWLRLAHSALPAGTGIFLGHTTLPMVEKYGLFEGREVRYLYLSDHPNRSKADITRQVLSAQSGPIMVLPVLLYMGYQTIYLLGCDHTNLRQYKKPIEHFYSKEKDIRKNSSDENAWDSTTLTMWQAYNLFSQYEYYKEMYKREGAEIVNLSKDSWLDMFRFQDLDEVL